MSVAFPEIRVGQPIGYKSLTVFPLFTDSSGTLPYALADEAIGDKLVTVEEVSEAGSVPELLVDNQADIRVLFIEGEELVGAKQNRVLNTSILIAAKTRMKIPVSCVEQRRWGYKTKSFGSSGSHSPPSVRYALKASVSDSLKRKAGRRSDQHKVWEEVEMLHSSSGVRSATGAMSDAFDAYEGRMAEFRAALQYPEGAAGMAVALGERVVSCDLFDRPTTCRKVWNRLLSGLLFDALDSDESAAQAKASDVDNLIAAANSANWEPAEPIGEGEEFRAEFANGKHASALTFQDELLHGSVLTAK